MTVRFAHDGSTTIAAIAGDVDMANTASLAAALMAGIDAEATALVLDLSDVRYLDSAGVQLLFDLARRLDTARRRFGIVVGEASPIRAVLKIAHVDEAAVLYAGLDECVEAVTDVSNGP
jgi:anti-anti-sigma factor